MYPQTFYGKMRVSLFRQEVRPVICCISDIHGELDKLEQMLELIRFSGEDHLYILGGVIVRGTLGGDIFWRIIAATNMTMLLGNHKQMCLRTLEPNNEFGARDLWRMTVGGQRFHLVHGYPGEGHETRIWGRVEPDNRSPFPDTICIVGHTPTVFLTDGHDEDFSIWHGDGILDIDCGCGSMKAAHRRLACLRLDDMAEFYVGGVGEGTS